MGYLTQKYSTIFRGPWITYMKERRLTTKMTRHMHNIHKSVFVKIPEEVRSHKVTRALKDIKALNNQFKAVGREEYKFVFDEDYQEEAVLKKIELIEKRLEQLRAQASAQHKKEIEALEKRIDVIIASHIIKAIKKLEQYDKDGYKDVMNIINAAKTIDKETLMNWIRTVPKDVDVSKWRRFPIRSNVRGFRVDIRNLGRDEKQIEAINKEIEQMLKGKKVKDSTEQIMKKIEQIAILLEAHLISGFSGAYKGMKRVLSLTYLLVRYEDTLDLQLEAWSDQKLIPSLPVKKDIDEVRGIRAKLVEEMHILGQALRRIYSQEKGIEKEAQRLAA